MADVDRKIVSCTITTTINRVGEGRLACEFWVAHRREVSEYF